MRLIAAILVIGLAGALAAEADEAAKPVNLMAGYYWNGTRPDGTADNQVRFQINFLWPRRR